MPDQPSTGLIDCGNWAVSASWTVPTNAVSGVYIAHLVRDDAQDPGGESQIVFVVRNDASHSDILVQTSDATWEAYNDYGGQQPLHVHRRSPAGNPQATREPTRFVQPPVRRGSGHRRRASPTSTTPSTR